MAHASATAAVSISTAARHAANPPRTGPSEVTRGAPAGGVGQAAGSVLSAMPWPGPACGGGRHTTAPRGPIPAPAGPPTPAPPPPPRHPPTFTTPLAPP